MDKSRQDNGIARLNLIGPGRLGQTLALLWQRAGLVQLQAVCGRDAQRVAAACQRIGAGQPARIDLLPPAELTLIATPDAAIAEVAQQLTAAGTLRRGDIVLHCSGATASSVLAPVTAAGAVIASVHPLKSFADPLSAAASFAGTWCGGEGDRAALAVLQPLFEAAGGQWFALQAEHKLLYHAGAVLACNHLVALMDTALQCMAVAGLPRAAAWSALQPLVQGTLANIAAKGTVEALTGPAARGDLAILQAEQTLTEQLSPEVGAVYAALTAVALQLAQRQAEL
ncbi:Rossmann-like and DUF2520 domain-containing protein [Amantichitinum ursilacus]|uniref:Rossmann-like domain protein n=1 Tax=Amantichitinum ursilacus TaxID=857265 RepID=A0A0N0XN28_9NEIS|nr:Rossmann-like and DUF2520 domain-containing protein [Amantichitinum ursilacus]KPC55305.1 Rossmann-like domain protein [Amantichitinum ursilacus]